ncbi:MAG: hypothetical protein E7453_06705 [Ruminococcaceae bacterium]|nr:hypothetical protein [Oscillospiraceae bacterium]
MEKKRVAPKRAKPEWLQRAVDFLPDAWQWIYRLRSILLAVPIVAAAIKLAFQNMARLPEFVGINLQANGEYAVMIERNVAVFAPLLITAVCLLTMFLSKKVLWPWLVSLFSLVLPLLLWITNIFPG